jgi:hypothetical protein
MARAEEVVGPEVRCRKAAEAWADTGQEGTCPPFWDRSPANQPFQQSIAMHTGHNSGTCMYQINAKLQRLDVIFVHILVWDIVSAIMSSSLPDGLGELVLPALIQCAMLRRMQGNVCQKSLLSPRTFSN